MRWFYFYFFAALLLSWTSSSKLSAQSSQSYIPAPDRKHVFRQDSPKVKKKKKQERSAVLKVVRSENQDLDFKARDVQFNKETNEIHGKGDVMVSRGGVQVQADEGKVNLTTKDSELKGNLVVSGEGGGLSAEAGRFNMESEIGEFEQVKFSLDNGNYFFRAAEARKISDLQYQLVDSAFTTCDCEEDYVPWEVRSGRANITRDGYAHTYNTSVRMFGLPVMYLPWFAFPVKEDRQSGLLVPAYSYSNRDGAGFKQPLFLVLDDSSDITVSPFIETRTRQGSVFDFRQSFSRQSRISARLLYSDESRRDGALRGTIIDGIKDPTIDENRLGGYVRQGWRSDAGADVPMSLYSDIHLVSDNLLLREMDDDDIGDRESRYTTSSMLFRASPTEWLSAEAGAEYNQALLTDQSTVFQRLPELSVSASRSLHPFGFNTLGMKVVPSVRLTGTEFSRDEGYDGRRLDINPGLRIPFHYQNYFNSDLSAGFRSTGYSLENRNVPAGNALLEESANRSIWNLNYNLGTALDRVYELSDGNILTYLSGLGASNQSEKLVRVRHNIEPTLRYYYVPPKDQADLPLFDSLDRIRARNVMVYGLRTSLDGRFIPGAQQSGGGLGELAPRLEDLPLLSGADSFADLGDIPGAGSAGMFSLRRGSVSELAYVGLKQAYDFREANLNLDPERGPLSDLGAEIGVSPSSSFALRLETNYGVRGGGFSSWAVGNSFQDDRGDALRSRFTFVDNSISQVEGNLEFVLTSRLSAGYYGRWDERAREFIENRGALRLASAYDCWFFDLGLASKINPDRKVVFFSFTFGGLGALTQNFGLSDGGN